MPTRLSKLHPSSLLGPGSWPLVLQSHWGWPAWGTRAPFLCTLPPARVSPTCLQGQAPGWASSGLWLPPKSVARLWPLLGSPPPPVPRARTKENMECFLDDAALSCWVGWRDAGASCPSLSAHGAPRVWLTPGGFASGHTSRPKPPALQHTPCLGLPAAHPIPAWTAGLTCHMATMTFPLPLCSLRVPWQFPA